MSHALPADAAPEPNPRPPRGPIARVQRPLAGSIRPPGSKSITNRMLLLAALADGRSRLVQPLRSGDTDRLLAALMTLGVVATHEGDDLVIDGVGGRFPRGGSVNLGDGGTPTRLIIAASSLAAEPVVVDGSARMRERPVAEGVALLESIGGRAEWVEAPDRLPVRVLPQRPIGGDLRVGHTSSSQFVSALMLIAPWLDRGLDLHFEVPPTSASYLALTLATLAQFDARTSRDPSSGHVRIEPSTLSGQDVIIEPDASAAVYWCAAAAMVPGSRVQIDGLESGSAQPDIGILSVLQQAGASWMRADEGIGVVVEGPDRLRGIEIDLAHMPDGAMAVAVMAATAEGASRLTGLATLKVKETNRLIALRDELRRVGCGAECGADWLEITPPAMGLSASDRPAPVVVETYRDHRMAMSFAILGLVRGGVSIADPRCVDKSYPRFWEDLDRLVARSA